MRTKVRRTLTGTALACAVGASVLAMSASASALTWHSTVESTVHTDHCSGQLVGHIAQSGFGPRVTTYYDASGLLASGSVQAHATLRCVLTVQLSKNGGAWHDAVPALSSWDVNRANTTALTSWYADNAPLRARVCLWEQYTYPNVAPWYGGTATSSTKCTAGW